MRGQGDESSCRIFSRESFLMKTPVLSSIERTERVVRLVRLVRLVMLVRLVRLVRLVVCSSIGPAIIGICLIQRSLRLRCTILHRG